MVDFVKLVIPPRCVNSLLSNSYLEFKQEYNEATCELTPKHTAEYKNMVFIIYDNSDYAELRGSLHKYYNEGFHNANDFGLNELLCVVNYQIND